LQITTEKKSKSVSYLTKVKRLCCRTVDWNVSMCFYNGGFLFWSAVYIVAIVVDVGLG